MKLLTLYLHCHPEQVKPVEGSLNLFENSHTREIPRYVRNDKVYPEAKLREILSIKTWVWFSGIITTLFMAHPVFAQCDPNNPLGCVINPLPAGQGGGGGLIFLLNNVLRLVFVVAGIYAFVRIVLAGVSFINAGGDTKKIQVAWDSIWQSLLGVVIVIASIAIAALLGLLLFGDATAILNPKVYGPK